MIKYYLLLIFICMFSFISCTQDINNNLTETESGELSVYIDNNINTTEYPSENVNIHDFISETIELSDFNFDEVDNAVIIDGRTGEKITVNDNGIINITDFLKGISGSSPQSSKGNYGFYYSLSLYNGKNEFMKICFVGKCPEDSFNYGIYESDNGINYPIMYKMSGATTEDVINLFSSLFDDNSIKK